MTEHSPTYDPNPDKAVVYVAGPYSADSEAAVERNIQKATWAATAIMQAGYYPFVPHYSKAIDDHHYQLTGEHIPWERWMDWSCYFLLMCQAVYVVGRSTGVDIELRIANEFGIPVVSTIEELVKVLAN